jgi:hypothetical protein
MGVRAPPAVPVTKGGARHGGRLPRATGGGWGPIVVSTRRARQFPALHDRQREPRRILFRRSRSDRVLLHDAPTYFLTAAGLILGGALAALLAGGLTKRLPSRLLMLMVGVVVLSLGTLGIVRLATS